MSLSLTIVSAFECDENVSYFVLPSLYIFLSTKTSVVTNLNSFNSVNNFLSLFLISNSTSLTFSSGLK